MVNLLSIYFQCTTSHLIFVIFQLINEGGSPLDMRYFARHQSVARSDAFINMREITSRHQLPPGQYCIVPSTFEPEMEGEFLMRIFSEKPNTAGYVEEHVLLKKIRNMHVVWRKHFFKIL